MTKDIFKDRESALEYEFFHKVDEELLEKLKAKLNFEKREHALADATGIQDEAVLARLHELARTALQGRHHGRSARERLQHGERTGIKVRRKHKSIRPREDLSAIAHGAQKMHAAIHTKTRGKATVRTWIVTATDENVPLFHARESLQNVAQTFRPEAMGQKDGYSMRPRYLMA